MDTYQRIAELTAHLKIVPKDYESAKELCALALGLLDPHKPMGTELFNAVARVTVTVALETVAVREIDGEICVYLTKRSSAEAYPNQWHSPGSALRPGEKISNVFGRLAVREFQVPIVVGQFIDNNNGVGEERGHFFTPIYLVELAGEPQNPRGDWFPIDNLPEKTVKHHREVVIPTAVAAYRRKQLLPSSF